MAPMSRARAPFRRTLLFAAAWLIGVGCNIPSPGTEPSAAGPDASLADSSFPADAHSPETGADSGGTGDASLGDGGDATDGGGTADASDGGDATDSGGDDASAGDASTEVAPGDPSVICVRRIFGPARQVITAVAAASDGRIAVVGVMPPTQDGALAPWADFGNGTVAIGTGVSAFVAVYDGACGYLWSRVVGPVAGSGPPLGLTHVAFDPAGSVVVAGFTNRPVDFGNGVLTPAGTGYDVLVAKYDSVANLVFAKRFGGTGHELVRGLAVDGAGDIYVGGEFASIDFGGGALYAQVGLGYLGGVFLAKLGPSGAHVFSKSFPLPSPGTGTSRGQFIVRELHASAAGDLTLVGSAPEGASIDFGSSPVTSTVAARFNFAARLTKTGAHVWSRSVTSSVPRAALLANGDVAITTGSTEGIVDFGNGVVPGPFAVGRLSSATGAAVWSRGLPHAQPVAGPRGMESIVAGTASGGMLVGLELSGTLDVGCGPHTGTSFAAGQYSADILFARLNSAGQCLYSMRFGDMFYQRATGLAVTPSGNSVLVGAYHGTITIGATTLPNYDPPSVAGPGGTGEDSFIAVFSK